MNTECRECGYKLPEGVSVCPECGASIVEETDYLSERPWYETDVFGVAIAPIMRWFDSGQFIRDIVCGFFSLMAIAFAMVPAGLSYFLFKHKALVGMTSSSKALMLCMLVFLLIFGCFSCGYWSRRGRMIIRLYNPKDEFVCIPIGSYFLQWIGDWLAILAGICGILMIILSFITVENDSWTFLFSMFANSNMGLAVIGGGILVAVLFRVSAESGRALASIANNTGRFSRGDEVRSSLDRDDKNEVFWNIVYTLSLLCTIGFILAAMLQK